MKNQKGITLISLIIYVILLTVIVAMLATISNLFFSNTKYLNDSSKYTAEFNKFNMYFIEDVKNNDDIKSISDTEIIFKDGTVYTFKRDPDNGIYRNKVKICDNIGYVNFGQSSEVVGEVTKKIINVKIIVNGSKLFETDNKYVLKYW